MRHDKIISSIQKRAVAFSFLSRKPTWAVLPRGKDEKRKHGKGRKSEGEIGEIKGKRKERKNMKRNVRQIHAKNHDVPRCTAMHIHFLVQQGLCSIRKRPTTLYILIFWTLLFDRRKKRKEHVPSSRLVSPHLISSRHWFETIDEDFLNDGWVIMWRTSLVLYPRQFRTDTATRL